MPISEKLKRIQNQIDSPAKGYDQQFESPVTPEMQDFVNFKSRPLPSYGQVLGFETEDFNKYLGETYDPTNNIDEDRAQTQSNASKLIKTLPRIGTKIVSEVAKMPGELYGMADWAASGFDVKKFEESLNNAWVQSIDEAAQKTNNELFPVYKRKVIENGGLLRQIVSPEFWATEGADGIGFLMSMMVPGMGIKALNLGSKIPKTLKLSSKLSKIVAKNADDFIAGGLNTLFEATAEGVEAAKATKEKLYLNKFNELTATGQYDPGEASKMAKEYIDSDEAKTIIGKVGANNTAANMAILLGPNILDQKWLMHGFNHTTKTANKLGKQIGASLSEAGKGGIEKTALYSGKQLTKDALIKVGIGAGKEGFFEEGLQSASSNYFQNRAIGTDDRNVVNGILGTYFEDLDDVDMQKSIFLGAALGGGMGGVASARQGKLEKKLLYGDKKKNNVGLIKLFENNFISRYKSLDDVYQKDKDGKLITDGDGNAILDPVKAMQWGSDIIKDGVNKKLLDFYESTGQIDNFSFAKTVHDFNYMLPFFEQPGGKDILLQHINDLAEKDSKFMEDNFGLSPESLTNIKQDLLDKVDSFEKIYEETVLSHKTPNIKVDKKDTDIFNEFNRDILNTKLSNELSQDFNVKKITELKNKILKIETNEDKTSGDTDNLTKFKKQLDNYKENLEYLKTERKELNKKNILEDSWNEFTKEVDDRKKEAIKNAVDNAKTSEEVEAANKAAKIASDEAAKIAAKKISDKANEETVKTTSEEKSKKLNKLADKMINGGELSKQDLELQYNNSDALTSILNARREQDYDPELIISPDRYDGTVYSFTDEKNKLKKYLDEKIPELEGNNKTVAENLARTLSVIKTAKIFNTMLKTATGNDQLIQVLKDFFKAQDSNQENKFSAEEKELKKQQEKLADSSASTDQIGETDDVVIEEPENLNKEKDSDAFYVAPNARYFNPDTNELLGFNPNTSIIDQEYVNSNKLGRGAKLKVEINVDDSFKDRKKSFKNSELFENGKVKSSATNQVIIRLIHTDATGNDHVVGLISAAAKAQDVRKKIVNAYNNGTLDQIKFEVTKKNKGYLQRLKADNGKPAARNTLKQIKESTGKTPLLGVIMITKDSGAYVNVDGKQFDVEIPKNGKLGHRVIIVPTGKGYIAYPLVTRKIKQGENSTYEDVPLTENKVFKELIDNMLAFENVKTEEDAELPLSVIHDLIGLPTFRSKNKIVITPASITSKQMDKLRSAGVDIRRNKKTETPWGTYMYSVGIPFELIKQIDLDTHSLSAEDYTGSPVDIITDWIGNLQLQIRTNELGDVNKFDKVNSRVKTDLSSDATVNSTYVVKEITSEAANLTNNNNEGEDTPVSDLNDLFNANIKKNQELVAEEKAAKTASDGLTELPKQEAPAPIVGFTGGWNVNKTKTGKLGESYETIDAPKATKWLQNKLPNIETQILNDIVELQEGLSANVYGRFKDGLILLASNSKEGTQYHEAFHAVTWLGLNPKKRAKLYDAARKYYDLKVDDNIIEERLADDFMDKIITDNITIDSWFKRLLYWIQENIFGKPSIEYMFHKINAGKYSKISNKGLNITVNKAMSSKSKLTPLQEAETSTMFAQEMTNQIIAEKAKHTEYDNYSEAEFLGKFEVPEDDLASNVLEYFAQKTYHSFKALISQVDPEVTSPQAQMLNQALREFVGITSDGEIGYGAVGLKSIKKFADIEGIRIKSGSVTIYDGVDLESDQFEINEENTQLEGWQIDVLSTSGKLGLAQEIRRTLSKIPDGKANSLGVITYLDFEEVYSTLKGEMTDLTDVDQMINKLEEIKGDRAFAQPVIDALKSDDKFRTKFFNDFGRTFSDYKIAMQNNMGQYRIYSANGNTPISSLITDWKTQFYYTGYINSDNTINVDKAKALTERLSGITNATDKWNTFLKAFDINLDAKSIEDLIGITNALDTIVNSMNNGENPFTKQLYQFRKIAKVESKFVPGILESAFRNGRSKLMYAHNSANFLSKQISRFKNKSQEMRNFYGTDPYFKASPLYNELIQGGKNKTLDNLAYCIFDSTIYKNKTVGTAYADMSDKQFLSTAINMWFNNGTKPGDNAWFQVPILSDAPNTVFVQLPKLNQNESLDKLVAVAKQEYARIQDWKLNNHGIKNYVKNGGDFHFLPFLNESIVKKAVEGELNGDSNLKAFIKTNLDTKFNEYFEALEKADVFNVEDNLGIDARIVGGNKLLSDPATRQKSIDKARASIKTFYYNSVYSTSQVVTLTSVDPSFYKNVTDFYKRNKQNWSPTTMIDTSASYELTDEQFEAEYGSESTINKKISVNKNYKGLYITDVETKCKVADELWAAYQKTGNVFYAEQAANYGFSNSEDGEWVEVGEDRFKTSPVNVADAQTFISPDRFRKIQIGFGRWNPDYQNTFVKLKKGLPLSVEDYDVVFSTIKPFYFGHGKKGDKVMPIQNKNSEYMLTKQLADSSPTLSKVYKQMIDNDLDFVSFESVVKSGLNNKITWEDLQNGNFTEDNYQILDNSDYGMQQETPNHYLDAEGLMGSQIRKLILSDISPDAMFTLPGFAEKLSKDQLVELYQNLIIANLKESYNNIEDRLTDDNGDLSNEKLSQILQEEVISQGLSDELLKAVQLTNGKFNVSLFNPIHSSRIERFINSIFKKNITKQKIKGGSLVQLAGVGYSTGLHLKTELDENGEMRLTEVECKLPWSSKKYFEPFMNESTGEIDMQKIIDSGNEDLLKIIGYRIPTEDKYSMLPLKVTGFLPFNGGGSIMLPWEITTIAGSDFDVDKLYVMMPEFDVDSKTNTVKKTKFNNWGLFRKKTITTKNSVQNTKNKSKINYTEEQEKALVKIKDFIKHGDPDEFFILEGKAGTGKTTIIKEIAEEFQNKTIEVAALSHKAKSVIKESFDGSLGKNHFNSIASLLGYTLDETTGKFTESNGGGGLPPIADANIVIIDEASMVNEEILEMIMDKKPSRCKVIFLGDIGQLPPIRTKDNPFYTNKTELLNEKSPVFKSKNKASLTERIRQGEDSPILPFADYFWSNSQSKNPKQDPAKGRENIIKDKGALLFTNSFSDIQDDVLDAYKIAVETKNPSHIKTVAYRNATRQHINETVHNFVFGRNANEFEDGELIIFNDNYDVFENSQEGIIEKTSEALKDENNIEFVYVNIRSEDGVLHEIPVVAKNSKKLYADLVNNAFKYAFGLTKKTPEYRAALTNAWNLKNKFANIDYGYAITSHKSQGSTYDIVVVNEQDIMSVGPISDKNKSESIYTALTRAKNISYVVSSKKVKDTPLNVNKLNDEINKNKKQLNTSPDKSIDDLSNISTETSTIINKDVISENSMQARNNQLIDIMFSVLTNSDSFDKFIKPGGFVELQKGINVIYILSHDENKEGIKGKSDKSTYSYSELSQMLPDELKALIDQLDAKQQLGIADPLSQFTMFSRNMGGAPLIGVFANHNSNHAIMQYTNLRLSKPILIGGNEYSYLNKILNELDERISNNNAQYLAAVVDNAKDPLAFKANINTFTADVVGLLSRLGVPRIEIFALIKQPVIVKLTELYYKNGGDFAAQDKAIIEMDKLMKTKFAEKNYSKFEDSIQITLGELTNAFDNKGKGKEFQSLVLDKFLNYLNKAKSLSTLISAMTIETKGAGPLMANNEVTVRKQAKIKADENLMGVSEIFNGSVYPMFKVFNEEGLIKPNELIEPLYPMANTEGIISKGKDYFASVISRSDLTVSDITKFNNALLTYLASNFDLFEDTQKESILKEFPVQYKKLWDSGKLDKYDMLKKHIKFVQDEKFPFGKIEVNNIGMDEIVKQNISDQWYQLLLDPELENIGENLIKYSYFKEGYQFGPKTFYHLVPVDYFMSNDNGQRLNNEWENVTKDTDLGLDLQDMYDFVDQLIRNNWKNNAYVPVVASDEDINTFKLNSNGVPELRAIAKNTNLYNDGKFVNFVKYKKESKDKAGKVTDFEWILYRKVNTKINENGLEIITEYVPTHKLGVSSQANEFSLNNAIFHSSVEENNKYFNEMTGPDVVVEEILSNVIDLDSENGLDISVIGEGDLQEMFDFIFEGSTRDTSSGLVLNRIKDLLVDKSVYHKLIDKLNVRGFNVVFDKKFPTQLKSNTYMYISNADTIHLNLDKLGQHDVSSFIRSFLHEMVHGYTIKEYKHNRNFKESIDDLFFNALDNNINKNLYGYTSPLEFIAEIMTNPTFALDVKNSNPSIYARIFKFIYELFFDKDLTIEGEDIYNKSVKIIDDIITNINDEIFENDLEYYLDSENQISDKSQINENYTLTEEQKQRKKDCE